MIVNKEFAKQIEICIKQSHINVAQKHAELGLESDILSIGSGAACFLGKDSFLSQVVGWGFDSDIKAISEQLRSVEKFYLKNNFPTVNIELSPLCGSDIANLLSEQGYLVTELSNISWLALDNYLPKQSDGTEIVSLANPASLAEWAKQVAIGFGCPEASAQFLVYAQAKNIFPFQVLLTGEIAAGSTIAMHEQFCDLGVTSTVPEHRGKGLQKALIQARLAWAKQQGAKFAIVTTEPGSISDANIQKLGFKTAYTRIKFSKQLT